MQMSEQRIYNCKTPLRCIGAGSCGSVWTDPLYPSLIVTHALPAKGEAHNGAQVIKREDCSESRSIAHEYEMHRRLLDAVNQKRERELRDHAGTKQFRVNFPDAYALVEPSHPAWREGGLLDRLPEGSQPCRALVNERVPPMPLSVRNLLIDRYCPAPLRDEIRQSEKNRDCIIRLYLGRRRLARRITSDDGRPPTLQAFSLRNLPLHIDQVRELGLPAGEYAAAMAEMLAFMFFDAGIDANDVELVLAPRRGSRGTDEGVDDGIDNATDSGSEDGTDDDTTVALQDATNAISHSTSAGSTSALMPLTPSNHTDMPSIGHRLFRSSTPFGHHALWIIDFDLCHPLPFTAEGMKRAAHSYFRNDPYFPRPYMEHRCDVELWRAFKARFLEASDVILQGRDDESEEEMRMLPRLFIGEVENICRWPERVGEVIGGCGWCESGEGRVGEESEE